MLPISENGIFWNVYEQECRFQGVRKTPPRFVRTTCDKLAALYPDLDDAEMFMRAQFTVGNNDIGYHLRGIVFSFKDFIMDSHHRVYDEYKRRHIDIVIKMLERAAHEIEDINSTSRAETLNILLKEAKVPLSDFQLRGAAALEHLPEEQQWEICEFLPRKSSHSTNPLVRYLTEKENCPQEYLEKLVRDCLHLPILLTKLPLTDALKERLLFYKSEVHVI